MSGAEPKRPTTPDVAGRSFLSAVFVVVRRAAQRFLDHDGFALAGYIAFVGILSLFPFLVFLCAVFGFFGVTEAGTYLAAFLFENIPESVAVTIETPLAGVFQETYGNLLTISMLGALWTAGVGIEGVRTALNRAYGSPRQRPYWRRRSQGTFLIVMFVGTLTVGLLFAPYAWFLAEEAFGIDENISLPWTAIRYGASAAVFLAATSVLYYWLPYQRPTWRSVLPGAGIGTCRVARLQLAVRLLPAVLRQLRGDLRQPRRRYSLVAVLLLSRRDLHFRGGDQCSARLVCPAHRPGLRSAGT